MKQNIKIESLSVKKFDKNFTDKYEESDQYVALQNSNIGEISGWNEENVSEEAWEILVKITNEETGKKIYRCAVGYTANEFTAKDIMLSYRSMKQLHVTKESKVSIQPTNWFCFLWHHAQSPIRYPFRIAFGVAVSSLLLSGIALALSIYQCYYCC